LQTIQAEQALTAQGWCSDVLVSLDGNGRIASMETESQKPGDTSVGVLLPAPANLHSHAFQRAMAGLSERRGPGGSDSFWTWRGTMYRFVDVLTPDDVEVIAALVQMEMLEAGFAAVAEFHYLHHQPGGAPYADIAEMSSRIAAAASTTGIGLTLLPVLYSQGGCDGRALGPGQVRFGNDTQNCSRLSERRSPRCLQTPSSVWRRIRCAR
jgi:formimidoylglutamate deiminase